MNEVLRETELSTFLSWLDDNAVDEDGYSDNQFPLTPVRLLEYYRQFVYEELRK